jgi:ABC-2 type transport system ATP-binding protein
VLVSTHLLAEVAAIGDRVLVIAAGRLVADGPVESLADTATSAQRETRSQTQAEALEAAYLRLTGAPLGSPDLRHAPGRSDQVGLAEQTDLTS